MDKLSPQLFKKLMDFAYQAYQEESHKDTLRQKGKTPYITHPVFAASLLLADRRIPWKDRFIGYQVLILHDVLEDTNAKLPDWLSDEVINGVKELTFKDSLSLENKFEIVKKKDDFIKLLYLCDTLSNLYEEHVALPVKRRKLWKEMVGWFAREVEKAYGDIRVVEVANAMIENTDW